MLKNIVNFVHSGPQKLITFRHPWITDWLTWVRVDGLFQFLFSQAVQNWHERQHKKKEKKKVSHTLLFFAMYFCPCCLVYSVSVSTLLKFATYCFLWWLHFLNLQTYPPWFGRHTLLLLSLLIINGPNSLQYLTGYVKERGNTANSPGFVNF